MQKKLKYQAILLLLPMLLMMCLIVPVAEAKVEAQNGKIVMDVQDAIDLYRYIAQLEAENKALREGLERERKAMEDYVASVAFSLNAYEQEREAWQKLEKEMNAELANQKAKTYKASAIALVLGGLIGAVVSD